MPEFAFGTTLSAVCQHFFREMKAYSFILGNIPAVHPTERLS
jgi:hypothetical protein